MRALRVIGVLVALAVGAAFIFGALRVSAARDGVRAAQDKVAADWKEFQPRFEADVARWKDDPLFSERDGGDASALLFAHVRWEGDKLMAPAVPTTLARKLSSYDGGWAGHVEELDVRAVDLGWLQQLEPYGHWSLEPDGGPLDGKPFNPTTEPLPVFPDVQNIARVRLAQGLLGSDARQAAREVRELARLCLTTESLIGEMIGVALLGSEARAYDEAVRRGQDVSGWAPVFEPERAALRRVLWAAQAPYVLMASEPLSEVTPGVGGCTGLHEGIGTAFFLRGLLQHEMPERYDQLGRALAQSHCRLRRGRAAWNSSTTSGQLRVDGSVLCLAAKGANGVGVRDCNWPTALTALPLARPFMANSMAAMLSTDLFQQYRPDAGH